MTINIYLQEVPRRGCIDSHSSKALGQITYWWVGAVHPNWQLQSVAEACLVLVNSRREKLCLLYSDSFYLWHWTADCLWQRFGGSPFVPEGKKR